MMLTVCSSASYELLTSVESLKTLLGTTTTADDALMSDILQRATGAIEAYLDQPVRQQTYYEKIASFGSMYLHVSRTPVQSISRILKDDILVSSTEYEIAGLDSGLIYRQYGWSWSVGTVTDLVPHPLPGTERLNFAVEYQAGYLQASSSSTGMGLPPALEQAALEIGKMWYTGRKRDASVTMKKVGDFSLAYESQSRPGEGSGSAMGTPFPPTIAALLQPFRRSV